MNKCKNQGDSYILGCSTCKLKDTSECSHPCKGCLYFTGEDCLLVDERRDDICPREDNVDA